MERYHIFKLGLAVIFYAIYCIRPMMAIGTELDDVNGSVSNGKHNVSDDQYYVYYQGVEGTPGIDFPIYSHIPRTSFSCDGVESGYYADLETDCQVFHICEDTKKISFLCPNGTVFQQADLICEWWFKVNCTDSPNLYVESAEQLKEDRVRAKANRRVIDHNNHGAVMRMEEHSSISASRNGQRYDVENTRNTIVPSRNRPSKSFANSYSSSQQNTNNELEERKYQKNSKAGGDSDALIYSDKNGGSVRFTSSVNGRVSSNNQAKASANNYSSGRGDNDDNVSQKSPNGRPRGNASERSDRRSNTNSGRTTNNGNIKIKLQSGSQTVVPNKPLNQQNNGQNFNAQSNGRRDQNGNVKIRLQSGRQTVVRTKGQQGTTNQNYNTQRTTSGNLINRDEGIKKGRSGTTQAGYNNYRESTPTFRVDQTVYDNFTPTTSRSTLMIDNTQGKRNGNIKVRLQTGTQVSGRPTHGSYVEVEPQGGGRSTTQAGSYNGVSNAGQFQNQGRFQNKNSHSKLDDAEVITPGFNSESKQDFGTNGYNSHVSQGQKATYTNSYSANVNINKGEARNTNYEANADENTQHRPLGSNNYFGAHDGASQQNNNIHSTPTTIRSTTYKSSYNSGNSFSTNTNNGVTSGFTVGFSTSFQTSDNRDANQQHISTPASNSNGGATIKQNFNAASTTTFTANTTPKSTYNSQNSFSNEERTSGIQTGFNKNYQGQDLTDVNQQQISSGGDNDRGRQTSNTQANNNFNTEQTGSAIQGAKFGVGNAFGANDAKVTTHGDTSKSAKTSYSVSNTFAPGNTFNSNPSLNIRNNAPANGGYSDISQSPKTTSVESGPQKGNKNNLFGGFNGNNIGLNKKDLIEKKIEPNDSDETQITQESASFVKNSANHIKDQQKSTTRYPNHRETYSEIKDPKEYKEKYTSSISSVTPQYVTTQTINDGKPFFGSTVGLKIKPRPFESQFGVTETSNAFTNPGFGTPSSKSPYTYLPKATSQSTSKSNYQVTHQSQQNDESYYSEEKTTTEFRYVDRDSDTTPFIVEKFNIGIANTELPPKIPTTAVTLPLPSTSTFNLGSTVAPLELLPPKKPVPKRGNVDIPNAGSLNRGQVETSTGAFHESGRKGYEIVKAVSHPPSKVKVNSKFIQKPITNSPPNINRYYTVGSNVGTTPTPNPLGFSTTEGPRISIPTGLPLLRRGSAVVKSTHKNQDGGKIKVVVTGTNYESTTSNLLKKAPEFGKYNGFSTNSIAGNSLSHSFSTFSTRGGVTTPQPNFKSTTSAPSKHTFSKLGEYRQFSSPRPFTVNESSNKKLHIDVSSPSESVERLGDKKGYDEASAFGKNILSSTLAPNGLFNTGGTGFTEATHAPNNVFNRGGTGFTEATPVPINLFNTGGTEATGQHSQLPSRSAFSTTEKYNSIQEKPTTTSPPVLLDIKVRSKVSGQASNAYAGCPYSHSTYTTPIPPPSSADNIIQTTTGVPPIGSFNDGKSTVKVSPTPSHIDATTKRIVDHATVWGTFSTTPTTAPTNSVFPSFQNSNNYTRFGGANNAAAQVESKTTTQSGRSQSPVLTLTPKVYVNDILHNEENSRPFSQNGFFVTRNSFSQTTTQAPVDSKRPSSYQKPSVNVFQQSTIKPRPFQLNSNTPQGTFVPTKATTKPKAVETTKPTYIISSAAPFSLSTSGSTTPTTPRSVPQDSQDTTVHRVPDVISNSVYDNVDNMIYTLINMSRLKDSDYSSETPRPGLVVPPSAGPQTLHSLAVYFANALDGMGVKKDANGNIDMDGDEKERLTLLLTKMTMDRYNELFGDKEPDSVEETTPDSPESASEEVDLQGQHSKNPIQNPEVRQLAKVFTKALADYLDDPDSFRQTLLKVRPTEPPPLPDVETTTNPDDELLNFSDADAKSSYPPIYPTAPSLRPTWGYILALDNNDTNSLDVKNSLNPDENLHQSDSQSFVSQFNSLTSVDKRKVSQTSPEAKTLSSLPPNHWTQSPDATKLWRTTLSVNPADINFNFRTTEATVTALEETTEEILPDDSLPSLEQQPHDDVSFELHSLPKLSLNATQVHGILIDFMNNTKSKEDGKLQRILRKLNTSEDEFLTKMKEIEANPLTRRLILLLISECGQNVTKEIESLSVSGGGQVVTRETVNGAAAKKEDDETLDVAPSSYTAGKDASIRIHKQSSSEFKVLVDPSLDENNEDTRALQLLNSLYSIASRFGK